MLSKPSAPDTTRAVSRTRCHIRGRRTRRPRTEQARGSPPKSSQRHELDTTAGFGSATLSADCSAAGSSPVATGDLATRIVRAGFSTACATQFQPTHAQLRLARPLVNDLRLPWERHRDRKPHPRSMTPRGSSTAPHNRQTSPPTQISRAGPCRRSRDRVRVRGIAFGLRT